MSITSIYDNLSPSIDIKQHFTQYIDPTDKGINYGDLLNKDTPESLAEQLGSSAEAVGALIYIKTVGDHSITHISNNFYLISLSFSYKERAQLLENFKSANLSFFGDTAKVYSLQGVALDYASTDESDPGKYFHQSGLIDMYEKVLRGSKLVESGSIAVLKVLNHSIEGYPISFQVSYSANADKMAQFTLNWVATNHKLTLNNVLTETRLKNFYDKKQKMNEHEKGILQAISELSNLRARKLFEDPDLNKLFDLVGSSNAQIITNSSKFLEMYKAAPSTTNNALAKKFVSIVDQYIDYINNLNKKVSSNSLDIYTEPKFDDSSFSIVDSLNSLFNKLQKLQQNIIITNINKMYGTPQP